MDFTLKCNSLKCRSSLNDRAVVTTCSHIFCIHCSDSSGLSNAASSERICPACETRLADNDDAVVTQLRPPESYKTSILSGFSPTIIMECAGRGLAFYTYQATQEIVYQEYLSKSLTEKCTNTNMTLDQLIHDANSEISHLRNKLATFEIDHASLRRKNQELIEAYNEKARLYAKNQAAYDSLKKRLLQTDFIAAATDTAQRNVYSLGPDLHDHLLRDGPQSIPGLQRKPTQHSRSARNLYSRVREGSSSSNETLSRIPEPPSTAGFAQPSQAKGRNASSQLSQSQQRTRLPVAVTQLNAIPGIHRVHPTNNHPMGYTTSTGDPVMRRPLPSLSGNAAIDSATQGYGLTPGGKSARRLGVQGNWESTHHRH